MEELEHAKARNVNIYCEIIGNGTSHDAYHIAEPSPDITHFTNAMHNALLEAEIKPQEIDAIFAHGNATIAGDMHETISIKKLCKEHSYNLAVPALESMIGHAFGAIGALKLGAAALSIQNQFIFPTINLESKDENCDLDYVANIGKDKKINYALVNSASFGGKYSVLSIKKYDT